MKDNLDGNNLCYDFQFLLLQYKVSSYSSKLQWIEYAILYLITF